MGAGKDPADGMRPDGFLWIQAAFLFSAESIAAGKTSINGGEYPQKG